MRDEFKYYKLALVAVLSCLVGAVLAGSMDVFRDTGGVWLGAIGTLLTLIFLIFQNIKLQKAQEKRDEEDSRIKKAQYLENRKKNFYSLLDEFKRETDAPIEFTSPYALYKAIYPTFHNNSNNYHLPSTEFINNLKTLSVELQNKLSALNTSKIDNKHFRELFHSLLKFQLLLHFELSGANLVRNRLHKSNVINVFSFNQTLDTYYQVASMICEECDITFNVEPFSIHKYALYELEFHLFRGYSIEYDMGIPMFAMRPVRHLNQLYQLAYNPKDYDTHFDYSFLTDLMELFVVEQRFWATVANQRNLLNTLETHINALSLVNPNSEFNNNDDKATFNKIFRLLREDHSKLLKEVRVQQFV